MPYSRGRANGSTESVSLSSFPRSSESKIRGQGEAEFRKELVTHP